EAGRAGGRQRTRQIAAARASTQRAPRLPAPLREWNDDDFGAIIGGIMKVTALLEDSRRRRGGHNRKRVAPMLPPKPPKPPPPTRPRPPPPPPAGARL